MAPAAPADEHEDRDKDDGQHRKRDRVAGPALTAWALEQAEHEPEDRDTQGRGQPWDHVPAESTMAIQRFGARRSDARRVGAGAQPHECEAQEDRDDPRRYLGAGRAASEARGALEETDQVADATDDQDQADDSEDQQRDPTLPLAWRHLVSLAGDPSRRR